MALADTNIYLAVIINGCATGFGVAIGTYFANKHAVKRLELLEEKLRVAVSVNNNARVTPEVSIPTTNKWP